MAVVALDDLETSLISKQKHSRNCPLSDLSFMKIKIVLICAHLNLCSLLEEIIFAVSILKFGI